MVEMSRQCEGGREILLPLLTGQFSSDFPTFSCHSTTVKTDIHRL